MHIAIDLRSLQSGKISGVENYVLNLVDNLLAIDKKNFYTFFYNSWSLHNFQDFYYLNSQVKATRIPNKILNIGFKLNLISIEKIIGKIDCLFLPNLNQFNIENKTKLAINVHDLSPVVIPEYYNIKRKLWHKFLNYEKAYKRADLIFAVSEYTKQDLIRLFKVDDAKIKVVNPGIDKKLFSPQSISKKRHLRNMYNIPGEFFLFLNTIEPRKNLEFILKAFEKLDTETSLVLAGRKGWKYRKLFKIIKKALKKIKFCF